MQHNDVSGILYVQHSPEQSGAARTCWQAHVLLNRQHIPSDDHEIGSGIMYTACSASCLA